MKRLSYLILTCILTISLIGCQNTSNTKISMNGSTSMEKLINALAESFQEDNPNITVESQFTGSSSGIEAVINKTADIANSSRSLKQEEKDKGLVENIIAIDPIAVITNTNNSIDNLTKQQLIDIYKGNITNWKEIGGEDENIVVIGRESGSGTRNAFEELLNIEEQCKYVQEIDSTGGVIAKVGQIKGAIGYVSLDSISDNVKALSIDNIQPTQENIKEDKYFLKRPYVMATMGSIEEQNEQIQAFFDYIDSDEGQEIIKEVGLISPK